MYSIDTFGGSVFFKYSHVSLSAAWQYLVRSVLLAHSTTIATCFLHFFFNSIRVFEDDRPPCTCFP